MMWSSGRWGELGLIFGVLAWMAPALGRAEPPKKVPDEVKLHQAEELKRDYERLYVEGKYAEASALAKRACSILEKEIGKTSIELAGCLSNLGVFYTFQGAYEKAEFSCKQALIIHENALDSHHPDIAKSLNNLAVLYLAWGAYGRAEPLYERALAILEKTLGPDHPDVATALDNLGVLHRIQGAYGKAEPLFERALAIYEKTIGPNHPDIATSLNNLANLYHAQGDYGRAESQHKRALAILEEVLGPNHPRFATVLSNLGMLYGDQGEYGKAEPLCKSALAIYESVLGPDHPGVAQSLNNLARLYGDQGEYGKAEPLCKRALAIYESALGPEHPYVAMSLNNLAFLHHNQGHYGEAEPMYKRALAIREKVLGSSHPIVAGTLYNLAGLYRDQGKHESALSSHRRALEIEEANLVQTLTVAEEARRLAFASTLSFSVHYALSLHLRVTPEHESIIVLALTTLLRRKSRIQDLVAQSTAALRRSLPEDKRHLLDDLADVDARTAVLSNHGPGTLTVEAFRQQLDSLERDRNRLWGEVAKHSPVIETLDHSVTIEGIQQALPHGSVLAEFAQYVPQHHDDGRSLRTHEPKPPPRYAAYLIFPDRIDWVDVGLAAPIDELIQAFRKALQTKQAIPTDLYDAVMQPIVEKLGSTHHLVIAPAGALSLVPFGALHDGEGYLVEKYDLRYVTTGRDLLGPSASPPVTTAPVTVVANPTGALLTDAETEADFLEGFFPDTRVLLDDQATETNVRTVERPLILHMATHGFFGKARNERDNPMFRSGLHLADIEQVEVDRERDDGQLTAYEVSGMDLRGTQLVVLSACKTGMGAVDMSEGVFGLRRAFAMAGARTTVMSLWEVSGVTAQTMMEAYYRKLAEGLGRGDAMQAVQLEMLRSKEHAHPKDWAAFIVSGDDDPMEFPAGQEPQVEPPPLEQPGPPPVRRRPGCATMAPPYDRNPAPRVLLLGLLGLTVLSRRRQGGTYRHLR